MAQHRRGGTRHRADRGGDRAGMGRVVALTIKQRAFIEHYLACWNASEAARRAGYSEKTAGQIGHENLKKPEIAAEIQAHIRSIMPAGEVLTRLAEQGRSTPEDFLAIERVKRRDTKIMPAPTDDDPDAVKVVQGPEYEVVETRIDLEKMQRLGKLHLIKKIKETRYGLEIELHDAQAALVWIGKHHGLFVDRVEATGADGAPLFPDFEQALKKAYAGDAPTTDSDAA